jgi:nucleoside-diphosphate-sugar epimerase
MLAVAESGTEEPVNLCTGVGTSMLELATLACLQVHHMPDITLLTDKPAGVAYRVGDPTRFHEFYKPQVPLVEGIARAFG